jgi:hypothetical protein
MPEGKIIFDGGVKTQSCDAVKAMIEFFDGEPCQKLPAKVQLANGWQLTKSSKGDCYYVNSARECSCPGFHYHRTCKHVKAFREAVVKEHVIDLHDTKPGEVEYWQQKEPQQQKKEEQLSPGQQLARNIVEAQEA